MMGLDQERANAINQSWNAFYSRGVRSLSEDTTYNYTPGGHTLTLCVSNPARGEIEAVQNQEAAFRSIFLRRGLLFIWPNLDGALGRRRTTTGGSMLR